MLIQIDDTGAITHLRTGDEPDAVAFFVKEGWLYITGELPDGTVDKYGLLEASKVPMVC